MSETGNGDVGDDGLTDTEIGDAYASANSDQALENEAAQRYRDATSLTPEQIQKAKRVLSDQRQAIVNEAKRLASDEEDRQESAQILAEMDALDEPLDDDSESDHAPHPPNMIGSLKGRSGYPDDPDALWVALKYDPSIDPEEIVHLTRILGEMHALDGDAEPLGDWYGTNPGEAERFYDYLGIHGVGPGWWRLILDCHRELTQMCFDYQINQIKQKLGGLKYYVAIPDHCNHRREEIQKIIDRYERRSRFICEETGYPGVLMEQTGVVATLNPKTAAPEWRVSTHSPLTTPEAIKNCPGAIDRLLNDLFHDKDQEVEARTAEHFTRHREEQNDDTD